MLTSDTLRWPEEGQYWALLSPLTLLRIKSVGEMADGSPGCMVFHTWGLVEKETVWAGPMLPDMFRYLWFNIKSNNPLYWPAKVHPGDVLYHPVKDRLFFIGPDSTPGQPHILADWCFFSTNDPYVVYQPGPSRRAPSTKTVYDHLRPLS